MHERLQFRYPSRTRSALVMALVVTAFFLLSVTQ